MAPLVASSVTVGRDQTCGLVLQPNIFPFYDENIQFNKISRVHFEIRRKNGVAYIMNKSMNGTFGNRTPLDKDRLYELRNTDKIAIISPALPLFAFLEERSYLLTSTLPVQVSPVTTSRLTHPCSPGDVELPGGTRGGGRHLLHRQKGLDQAGLQACGT